MGEVKRVTDATITGGEPDGAGGPAQKRTLVGMAANGIGVTIASAAAVAAIAGGAMVLHSHAESGALRPANPSIAVRTEVVKWSDHYNVTRSYIGRLEAMRETAAAFERGGLVVEVKFDEGDAVAKGAVIARLDTARLAAGRRGL